MTSLSVRTWCCLLEIWQLKEMWSSSMPWTNGMQPRFWSISAFHNVLSLWLINSVFWHMTHAWGMPIEQNMQASAFCQPKTSCVLSHIQEPGLDWWPWSHAICGEVPKTSLQPGGGQSIWLQDASLSWWLPSMQAFHGFNDDKPLMALFFWQAVHGSAHVCKPWWLPDMQAFHGFNDAKPLMAAFVSASLAWLSTLL